MHKIKKRESFYKENVRKKKKQGSKVIFSEKVTVARGEGAWPPMVGMIGLFLHLPLLPDPPPWVAS